MINSSVFLAVLRTEQCRLPTSEVPAFSTIEQNPMEQTSLKVSTSIWLGTLALYEYILLIMAAAAGLHNKGIIRKASLNVDGVKRVSLNH